jgi:hypothetical protein
MAAAKSVNKPSDAQAAQVSRVMRTMASGSPSDAALHQRHLRRRAYAHHQLGPAVGMSIRPTVSR